MNSVSVGPRWGHSGGSMIDWEDDDWLGWGRMMVHLDERMELRICRWEECSSIVVCIDIIHTV